MTQPTPAEQCGHQPAPVLGRATECVLRPGHQGSHADETGMRWWMTTPAEQPVRHTVDSITDDALDALYARIDTLDAVCESNKRAYIGAVEDAMAADKRAEESERKAAAMTAAMESTAADALRHRGCHMNLMAQCTRAERAEAAIERVRAELSDCDDNHWMVRAGDIRAALDEHQEQQP